MPGSLQGFAARFDENNQEFSLSGTVRPETGSEIADCMIGSRDIIDEEGASICRLQLFDGPLELSWHHCATTSDFISDLCVLRVHLPFRQVRDVRHSVAYLTNELLENAVKFKSSGNIGVQAAIANGWFTIKTWNRMAAGSAVRLQSLLPELMP